MRKYTPRAQRKPPGGSRAGRRARETGGVGKPARFCQEETHVLAEQFSSMEHDAFRVPYLPDKTLEAAFNGQAVDRGEARPSASNDFIEERRTARRKLMSVLQRGDPPGRQGTLAARSVAGCWPRSSAT